MAKLKTSPKFPRYTVLAQYAFGTVMWEWADLRAKNFNEVKGYTQTTPSQYALALACGEHCAVQYSC